MAKKLKILKDIKVLLAICVIACTALLVSFGSPMAQLYEAKLDQPTYFMTNVSLSSALASGRETKGFYNSNAMHAFYQQRMDQPFWVGNFGPSTIVEPLLDVFEKSWTHGLNPARYNTDKIRKLMGESGFEAQGQLELLLTDAFLRYASDLSGMRVDPAGLKIDGESWRRPRPAEDLLALLDSEKSLEAILRDIEPQGRTYKILQQELVRLTELGDESYVSVLPISFGNVLMKPAWRHKSVPALRMRLGVEQQTKDALLYDDALAAAVMKFQREHRLMDDGIIGSSTLQALNRTRSQQILQIVANLERLRWVDEAKPDKFVVVNIPSATLWAVNRGKVAFEMDVVVGQRARATESFIADITGVRFNPDWTVPPTIKKFDILPKVQEDPNYLKDKGIELIRGHGEDRETLDPDSIDWDTISWKELNSIQMVQIPGEHNPLGQIRILMPNKFNIYLHDTNHPEFFDRPERAASSGCIRLKEPEKMAKFVMASEKDWNPRKMDGILAKPETTDLMIERPIPVYVLYYTVWTDEKGDVVYGTDIYNQDPKLIEKLAAVDGFRIPGHNGIKMAGSAPAELVSMQ